MKLDRDENLIKIKNDRALLMEKSNSKIYPKFSLPNGFTFSSYSKGMEMSWIDLQAELGLISSKERAEHVFLNEFLRGTPERLQNKNSDQFDRINFSKIEDYPLFYELKKRMFFILNSYGKIVGTGTLWWGDIFGKTHQRLHWIGVSKDFQGRALASCLLTKLMDIFNELSWENYLFIKTQISSFIAINLYKKFGFTPYLGEKPKNWHIEDEKTFKTENKKAWNIVENIIK